MALPLAIHLGAKVANGVFLRLDGRSASVQGALVGLHAQMKPDVPSAENVWRTPLPAGSYVVSQRQVVQYPAGILYALNWTDSSGMKCLATAFVEEMWDNFGGWKQRGAYGRCSQRKNAVWVNGWNEINGFTVAYGLVENAALVEVTWHDGSVTRAKPIDGSFMSVLDRQFASVQRVDFFDDAGEVVYTTSFHVG